MAYGLKYSCTFDRVDATGDTYTIQILQNNYGGSVTNIVGSSTPVSHTWETDDPKAPIKGSSLAITLINQAGNIPLTDLYSTDDQEFKAKLIINLFGGGTILLFEGFIVQDDSSELMVDYTHEITLSANDNLGLLKDIPFNQALLQKISIGHLVTISSSGFAIDMPLTLLAGDKFDITDATTNYGTYTVATVVDADSYTTTSTMPFLSGPYTIVLQETTSQYDLISLLRIVQLCLKETGLSLVTRVFANINESSQTNTVCFLEQTFLDPQTFNSGSSWDDCYQVLEKVLTRFNATLFQAKGYWNIVRWDEARYYDYAVPGFIYDSDFKRLAAQKLDDSNLIFGGYPKYLIGIGESSVAENGLLQRVNRPFKYVKETFTYRQPPELLRNANLQQLGNLITTYTTGSGSTLHTIKEYEVPWWTIIPGSFTGTSNYFIRVVTDSLDNEIDRTLVLVNGAIESFPIQAAAGDRFTFSFTVITTSSTPGNFNVIFEIKDYDGSQTKYLHETTLTWTTLKGYTINVASGDNGNVSHSFDISGTIPYDGLLTVSLEDFPFAGETQYRDIRMEYIPMINQSTKIIGQTHTSEQDLTIKNISEKDIDIDNSPRNSIAGTLFLNSLTGLLQTRAAQWKRHYIAGNKNLGEITTFENLFLRRLPRTLLEGTFHGLVSAGNQLSPLSVIQYTFFSDLNFIFGRMEIDYRNNSASGTLYELYKGIEVDGDLSYFYLFQYLYAAK